MRRSSLVSVATLLAVSLAVTIFIARPGSMPPKEDDKEFVEQMIPHHHLGMRLIDEATLNSQDVRLRRLVFEMGSYHGTEAATLEAWADQWALTPSETFPGALPESEIERLAISKSINHDIQWLAAMIRHHEGALVISEKGRDGRITQSMAATIWRIQQQQIEEMRDLLNDLCQAEDASPECSEVLAETF
ncbi:unannotated protein [freshwater metagenome]|uniref:Unannotated protein n=1 Tax=freshwater metagenome TaxID=449393 RepID=A0A6J6D972_9ZZZZ|nr:DUF305 domain-containing protein [Actinomycetota bacterium]MSZ14284.1 DUF305 domain-containing protein [Actinomycetota bacterium]MTA18961.1 DUF305 domain-containing protein [Actinomycetota bacterium]MTA87777.1 DUF305 domain-containing protein [Actinomycetota bacterium]